MFWEVNSASPTCRLPATNGDKEKRTGHKKKNKRQKKKKKGCEQDVIYVGVDCWLTLALMSLFPPHFLPLFFQFSLFSCLVLTSTHTRAFHCELSLPACTDTQPLGLRMEMRLKKVVDSLIRHKINDHFPISSHSDLTFQVPANSWHYASRKSGHVNTFTL